MNVIVAKDSKSKTVFAHVVPCKGSDEDKFVINLIVDAVNWLGHVKTIMKTDHERSLVSLAKQALQALRVQVESIETATLEHSQAYDSQPNGGTGVGIRAVRGIRAVPAIRAIRARPRGSPYSRRCGGRAGGCWIFQN